MFTPGCRGHAQPWPENSQKYQASRGHSHRSAWRSSGHTLTTLDRGGEPEFAL